VPLFVTYIRHFNEIRDTFNISARP